MWHTITCTSTGCSFIKVRTGINEPGGSQSDTFQDIPVYNVWNFKKSRIGNIYMFR